MLLVRVREAELRAFGGALQHAALVHKHFYDKGAEPDRFLLNLCSDDPELRALARVLGRVEDLSHVLAWSKCPGEDAKQREGPRVGGAYSIDFVELPRLHLKHRAVMHTVCQTHVLLLQNDPTIQCISTLRMQLQPATCPFPVLGLWGKMTMPNAGIMAYRRDFPSTTRI